MLKEGGSFLSLFFFFFFKGEIERMDGWMDGRKEEELLRSFFPSSSSFFLPPSLVFSPFQDPFQGSFC